MILDMASRGQQSKERGLQTNVRDLSLATGQAKNDLGDSGVVSGEVDQKDPLEEEHPKDGAVGGWGYI